MRTNYWLAYFLIAFCLLSCHPRENADLLLFNGKIYTVDSAFTVTDAMVIREGKILETGSQEALQKKYAAKKKEDLQGRCVYPGFIDAHCHFYAYATMPLKADVTGTRSFEEVLTRLQAFQLSNNFPWLLGQGWDQNDWEVKTFPTREKLDSLFPHIPVFVKRVDGHAVLCNSAALSLANITAQTRVAGGEVVLKNGVPTGVLIDNAVELVQEKIPVFPEAIVQESLLKAQDRCFAAGLTTVCDAGLGKDSILFIHRLQQSGMMKIRVMAMVSDNDSSLSYFFRNGPIKTPLLNVRSIKLYGDGALGSRGACLLKPYSDAPGHLGFLLSDTSHMARLARQAYASGFQLCTHCIGDSGTRTVLKIYAEVLKGANDKRWRIEHCQVVQPSDLSYFHEYSVLPSVQPTHATSDMYWAAERLGPERIHFSYAYQDLLKAAGHIAFGTDFPVEDISPVLTFYAAVSRQDTSGLPPGGFEASNAVSRRDALRAMTYEAAYAAFEENEKGRLQPGMLADFVVLDRDIMEVPVKEIPKAKVVATWVSGERVFTK